eukprot:353810-Chlamydomonas_euryale.AAC.3
MVAWEARRLSVGRAAEGKSALSQLLPLLLLLPLLYGTRYSAAARWSLGAARGGAGVALDLLAGGGVAPMGAAHAQSVDSGIPEAMQRAAIPGFTEGMMRARLNEFRGMMTRGTPQETQASPVSQLGMLAAQT